MLLGIDVSHHNTDEQIYQAMNEINVSFVIHKASEGRSFVDKKIHERFDGWVEKYYGEKIVLGAYHFARPDLGNTPGQESENFLLQVLPYIKEGMKLILAIDIEGAAASSKYRDWYEEWLNTVYTVTGIHPVIYCGESTIKMLPSKLKKDYGLWVAKWPKNVMIKENGETYYLLPDSARPKTFPWDTWAFWQYEVNKSLNIDTNLFNGEYNQLIAYARSVYSNEDEGLDGCDCHCGCKYCDD